ncbi:MAG: hypothetical protein DWG83_02920 [Chloroflexi bacterium]|nr:pyridoxamine 5'-phosphate oxidase family protein [Chloroflexota bacterium]MQC19511.1 hypothetical protein [Chloroflexota bacterium]
MEPKAEHAFRARALANLRGARNYWIATTTPAGRPHSAPVWGVWLDGALWFGTEGQKAKNLAATPYAVAHLDSGDDVVIVRGPVTRVEDAAALGAVVDAFRAKYVDGVSGEPLELLPVLEMGERAGLYRLDVELFHAWLEGAFEQASARWRPK